MVRVTGMSIYRQWSLPVRASEPSRLDWRHRGRPWWAAITGAVVVLAGAADVGWRSGTALAAAPDASSYS
jgi:hypothetical protein